MREFKGTKGNWHRGGNVRGEYSDIVYSESGEKILEIISNNYSEDGDLVAAAPELLEALQGVVKYIDDFYGVDEIEYHTDHPISKSISAIKKALGVK